MSTPVQPGPHATRGSEDSRSLGEIVGDIATDLSRLVKQEIDLAKTELKQEASRAGKGAGMLAGAGVAGHFVLLFASIALMLLLDNWIPVELGALVVAGLWLLVAAALGLTGRKSIQQSNPQLPRTQQSLKEDASWARQQKS